MKKLLVIVISIVCLGCLNCKAVDLPPKTDHEKVKLYLFYSDSCPHCHDFINYFLEGYRDDYKDYFEIVTYLSGTEDEKDLTDYIKANGNFANTLGEYFGIPKIKFGFPFIVIGDYYTLGFADGKANEIINEALKQYQNESYEDIVEKIAKVEGEDIKEGTLYDAAKASGIKFSKDNILPDGVVIFFIVAALVGGLGGLVYLTRKQSK